MEIGELLVSILFSAIVSYVLSPTVIRLAHRLRLVDDSRIRKHPANIHKGIVPRAGGIGIYFAILLSAIVLIPMNKLLIGILLGGFLIVLMGILDDYFDLSAMSRLIMNIIIVAIVILFGLGIPYITNPFGGVIDLQQIKFTYDLFGSHEFLILSNLFALIWIVALMNFVSWSSGVDGQLSGFTAISSIILGLVAIRFSSHEISAISVTLLAFIVGGAYAGFLPWHFYPQKIMPGYSGGALSGYMLGVLSILSWGKVGTMALVLAVPLVDAMYIILRRLIHKQSPFKGDAGHFHHRLMEIGWGKRRIAVFYWFVSLLFGLSALYLHQQQKILALSITVILLAIFIILINRIKLRSSV
ncbi:undecaprenyl/decaprenyl-phosphate alpha-N-acetylglucosaminyl 1-phosphate transferase [Candidatus Woesebacteria bacterium]|nr:undecaprenyl/decaprenyl-phosphate alpha-N-acetylglucosaminyl 1-phosphate transferase [Candidatus Woesebacteria bacterium]